MNKLEPVMMSNRDQRTTLGLTSGHLWHAAWLGVAMLACAGNAPPAATATAANETAANEAAASRVAQVPSPGTKPINGFSAASPWNQPLPAQIPLAPNSRAIVANLLGDRNNGFAVWPLMTETFSAPIYVADPNTPLTKWEYDNCTQAPGLHPPFGEALAAVPTLPDMLVSNGSDGEIAIYQPSTDTYWDFWRAQVNGQGQWSACWGGKIDRYSESAGVFDAPLGATATGIALGAFLIRIEELKRGHIDHAVNIATTRTRKDCQSWPANRNDGNTDGADIACEGQRFRLDPSFDASTLKSPAARTIARAMQQYGLILTDKSDALITQAEDPRPHMAKNGGQNPYDDLLGGVPWYIALNDIPVDRLEALPIDYGKTPPGKTEGAAPLAN
jgi:hypothetical protein